MSQALIVPGKLPSSSLYLLDGLENEAVQEHEMDDGARAADPECFDKFGSRQGRGECSRIESTLASLAIKLAPGREITGICEKWGLSLRQSG